MSTTYTLTETFNITHARRLAAKVVADMHQCNRLYARGPAPAEIAKYEQELVVLLAGGYVDTYECGFQSPDGRRVLSWKYTVSVTGDLEGGRSGGLYATADLASTTRFNFLSRNHKWWSLSETERTKIDAQHNVDRVDGNTPLDGNGYWTSTRSYASGGVGVMRQEFRPL